MGETIRAESPERWELVSNIIDTTTQALGGVENNADLIRVLTVALQQAQQIEGNAKIAEAI
jgi:hypothetical protein